MSAVSDRKSQVEFCLAQQQEWDLIVVGGGITGAGVMLRAAQAGMKVLLLEQNDFAWGTSSRSSKMVHGGLRYLVSGQFSLTRESVRERELLSRQLPGLVKPMSYVYAHYKGKWVTRIGFRWLMKLYDLFAGRRTHRALNFDETLLMLPGMRDENLIGGTRFEDAVTDDARLVMRTLDEARALGGAALNYVKVNSLIKAQERVAGVEAEDKETQQHYSLRSKCVINATGVWVDSLWDGAGEQAGQHVRPLRGSHIVLPGHLLPIGSALALPHPDDGRNVFIFPWDNTTVVGTTDLDHKADLDFEASISQAELEYLLTLVNYQFPLCNISAADLISTWAGVRPVLSEDDTVSPSDEKREHACWSQPGLVSISGGKLTTFRCIADNALALAKECCDLPNFEPLPEQLFVPIKKTLKPEYLSTAQHYRLRGRYGKQLDKWITQSINTGYIDNSPFLWCELGWAAQDQQVVHLDDLLLRRTRIGLQLKQGGTKWLPEIRELCQALLGWDDAQWSAEEERYRLIISSYYSIPEAVNG